jgi:hypothetical protein
MNSSDGKQNAQESGLESLLAAHLDALIAGQDDFDPQLTRYGLTPAQTTEATDLLSLAQRLRETLTPVAPSEAFTSRLKGELIGDQPVTLLVRWRKLPAHYQLAAKLGGLTLTAGILLLASRRALNVLDALQHREQSEGDQGLSMPSAS